jgi:hypothetical protein
MQAVAGQPFTTTLIDPAGISEPLGARVEVPVTRAIVSAWQQATLDGATWSVTLDAPVTPGEYLLVWRSGDPEPPVYETFLPLTVTASGVVVGASEDDFPLVNEEEVRPDVDDIANLANTRTASGGGGEISEFNEDTDPTATQVESLIDRAVEAVLAQLPTRFSTAHYERVRHAVELYTLVLGEGSFFSGQLDSSSVDLWRTLLSETMNGLRVRIEEERREARKLGRMEPRPLTADQMIA